MQKGKELRDRWFAWDGSKSWPSLRGEKEEMTTLGDGDPKTKDAG